MGRFEKVLLSWVAYAVAAGVVLQILFSVFVYMAFDCWPLLRAGNNCLAKIGSPMLVFAPMLVGALIGAILAWMLADKADKTE